MADTKKTLLMTFETEGGQKTNVTLANIKEGLTKEVVQAKMQAMVDSTIFTTKTGAFKAPYRAQVVDRTATTLFGDE